MLLEGLGKSENVTDFMGNPTRDHPAFCIVPQPTSLLRTPQSM
jgi:hypothetical protein